MEESEPIQTHPESISYDLEEVTWQWLTRGRSGLPFYTQRELERAQTEEERKRILARASIVSYSPVRRLELFTELKEAWDQASEEQRQDMVDPTWLSDIPMGPIPRGGYSEAM